MVQYEFNPVYVKAVFPGQVQGWEKTTQESGEKLKLGNYEGKSLELIKSNPNITITILAETLQIGLTTLENNLAKLKKKGLIARVGPDKGGSWAVIERADNEWHGYSTKNSQLNESVSKIRCFKNRAYFISGTRLMMQHDSKNSFHN